MRTASALVLAALYAAGCTSLHGSAEPIEITRRPHELEDSVREARNATVRVRSRACGLLDTGSGVHIGEGRILTNRHVVEAGRTWTVTTWDGKDHEASWELTDTERDLAILVVQNHEGIPAAGIPGAEPQLWDGMKLMVSGHPEAGMLTSATANLEGAAPGATAGQAGRILKVDVKIKEGSSGGPVIDSYSGTVVGVMFAYEEGSGAGLAIPVWEDILPTSPVLLTPSFGC